ncbi:MAG: hypothetical protein LBH43_07485 [Treponema sp.]|jgi:hypothetical protein|nr:hypothetical protein [Treponema sp.]
MVTMVTEKRVLNCREVEAEYDGRWFLYDQRDFPPEEDTGYVVAYGDGTPEDRGVLTEIQDNKYHGNVLLMKGWIPKDDIFDSGIIEAV